jgi:hypothetical protein
LHVDRGWIDEHDTAMVVVVVRVPDAAEIQRKGTVTLRRVHEIAESDAKLVSVVEVGV